ncbi:MAG: protein translocase subunit SecD [Fuerstiella sp.]|nr:protein translocase subunit SecD [Fuerstiella sp.]
MFDMFTGVLTLAVQEGEAAAEGAAEAAAPAAEAANIGGGTAFAIFVTGLIGAFILGAFLAKAMKVTDWGFRFGVCLAALAIGVMPFMVRALNGETLGQGIRLGIDLAGGTNMVFQVMETKEKPLTDEVMEKMVGAVIKRINPSGTAEITVRRVGKDRIEVIVPGKDAQTVNDIKRRITKLGSLQFFITASRWFDSEIISQAKDLSLDDDKLLNASKEVIARWMPVFEKDKDPQVTITDPGDTAFEADERASLSDVDEANESADVKTKAQYTFLQHSDAVGRDVELLRTRDGVVEKYKSRQYLVLVDPEEQWVTGEYLKQASWGVDPQSGGQIVTFRFNTRGAFLFSRLTSRHLPQPGKPKRGLGIVLDDHLYSAPVINSTISENGQIEGNFTVAEVRELTGVLNAGALHVPINPKPLSEATVDPTLGEDVSKKGVLAIMAAAIVVVLFMLAYYRFAGIVAVICLFLNLVLVLTIMMAVDATFTLPGLAGLVLTIGMAVDANVLIFERMREETNRGSSLRMAIQNGFSKAFTTIVDANVTTLITAVILYMIGTEVVKGFAVSLFIGILMSMFTALYVGRVIFDVAEKKRWITKLNMFSIVGTTQWNFLARRRLCAFISCVLIAGGLAAFFSRGENSYDIDFTGGTMVTFQLTESAETESVHGLLKEQFTDNFTLERLTLVGADGMSDSKHFRLRTTESDNEENAAEEESAEERVRVMVDEAFNGQTAMKLRKVSMEHSGLTPFAIAEDDDSAQAMQYKRFNGGHTATISLSTEGQSTEVAMGTISDMLADEIEKIGLPENSTYPDPEAVFAVEGLKGSGLNAVGQEVQKFSEVTVRGTSDLTEGDFIIALGEMKKKLDSRPLFDEVNTFASAVAREMKTSAIMAIIISLLAIVAYIWVRFQKITFGLAAVVALVHDVLIVLGLMALASYLSGNPIGDALLLNDFRINLPMVAAFLTVVGYSLNDTIVVFDRIREVRGKNPGLTDEIVNTSLNQTLSRTLLTSLTTFFVVIILYVFGGEGIHGFAFCLTLGVIVGTYSSIYVASPVLVWLMNRDTTTA